MKKEVLPKFLIKTVDSRLSTFDLFSQTGGSMFSKKLEALDKSGTLGVTEYQDDIVQTQ